MAGGHVHCSSTILLPLVLALAFFSAQLGYGSHCPQHEALEVVKAFLSTDYSSLIMERTAPLVRRWRLSSPHGSKYFSTQICWDPNSQTTFNLKRLSICGDINPNPGPTLSRNTKILCPVCEKTVAVTSN